MARRGLLTRFVDSFTRKVFSKTMEEAFREFFSGFRTAAGKIVSPESALRVSAFYACIKVISETVGSLPLQVFQRLDSGKSLAGTHPLFALLHDSPNSWQTSLEFREMMTAHCLLRGNAYAYKLTRINAQTGAEYLAELIPMHPDRVKVEQLPNFALQYTWMKPDGTLLPLPQEKVFHLRAFTTNGYEGRTLIQDIRELLGKSLAMSEYSSRLFANDATPGVILKHPTKLSDPAYKRIKESWDSKHAGSEKAGETAILEEGMTIEKLTFSNVDSQFIESTKMSRSEIAGVCRVPPHLIGDLDRATFSNIEEQNIAFVTHCIRPWCVRWEQALSRDLFLAPQIYYPQHNLEGLLRGNIQSRYAAYAIGRMWGWLSADDVREREDMNPIPDGGGQVYLSPQNMESVDALMKKTQDLAKAGATDSGGNKNASA